MEYYFDLQLMALRDRSNWFSASDMVLHGPLRPDDVPRSPALLVFPVSSYSQASFLQQE